MQNRKEELTEFVKTTKNKVHDWWVSYNRKLWTTRIFVYVFLLLLVIFVGAILFAKFNLFHTDANSARYMLSALVQSQAAIVAIVITLTLIAVQLTASAYSPRVMDIFKKNPDMWILLSCYGFSIFYGFIVLKLVEGAEGEFVSQSVVWSLGPISISFEFCVSLAYWLGAFTFVVLFLYMLNIIDLLKPPNIIKRLSEEITRDKILKYIELAKTSKRVETRTVDDPIQPIVDIIHGSIMKYDLDTTRVGLKAVTDQVIKIVGPDEEKEISGHFCKHLERAGRLAVSKMDEESTAEVIENLKVFGKSTAEKGLKYATAQTAEFLEAVGVTAAEKGLAVATWRAVESLEAVGKAAAEKSLEKATQHVARYLGYFGKSTAEKGLVGATRQIAWTLEAVGVTAAERGLVGATRQAAESLVRVGLVAAEKGLEDATLRAARALAELTILSEEVVKTAIHNYESKLNVKQELFYFQKFMKLYEQELEKLRAEKRTANKKTESRQNCNNLPSTHSFNW